MSNHHLTKFYPKPKPDEYIPITFIDIQKKYVGWSNKEKRLFYFDNENETNGLKNVKKINLMKIINHISCSIGFLELSDNEREEFEQIYDEFLKKGGIIIYKREKKGLRKFKSFFELWENEDMIGHFSEKSILANRI